MTDQPAETNRRRRKPQSAWRFTRDVLIVFVAAVLLSAFLKAYVVRSFYIPSASMMNTLHVDDRIIVNELQPGLFPLDHGDVVVFRDPGGWLGGAVSPARSVNPIAQAIGWFGGLVGLDTSDSNDHLIKRIIGLPGDHVVCCNDLGQMTVNGTPLREPYVLLPAGVTAVSGADHQFDVTVPKDSLWVMGDNRYDSADSRFHLTDPTKGFVPISDVVGRAVVITWPFSRWSFLDDYPATFSGVSGSVSSSPPQRMNGENLSRSDGRRAAVSG